MLDRIHIILLMTSMLTIENPAQGQVPSSRFIHPMDIPLELSGNFMEPRNDHFHSGLDIRTQGREGIPVRAVADGWVSRIKISPWGYGKAVYIEHPSGHTSVYGHLQQLQGPVAEACLNAQYRARDFSIDIYPEKGSLPVKQGEVIALSGNTGSSGGPHLHFELRRSGDQRAIDPETMGIRARDSSPPEILGVRLHPLNDSSRVAPYPPKAKGYAAQGSDGRFGLKAGDIPSGFGTVGISLHTLDRYDNSSARFGVRSIELFVDSIPVFSSQFTEVDFDLNRYCNAHMEYGLFKDARMEYHRCYLLPNNRLRIYGSEAPQGRVALTPGRDHHVRALVTDGAGNTAQLSFILRGATEETAMSWPAPPLAGSLFRYDARNVLEEEGLLFSMPPNALYDDAYVSYTRRPAPAKAWAPVHVIHDPLTPVHSTCELSIAVPELPSTLRSKALVVRLDQAGKPTATGGEWADGNVSTKVRSFGAYTVMVDTVPPVITNVDLRDDMRGRSSFSIKITDDLSGIASWRGTINGQWVLLEYDPKTNALYHRFDRHTEASGDKDLELTVTDDRGNSSRWNKTFTR